jgi:ATP-dependent Zn protease
MSARNYVSSIDVAMGGRAAEDIIFGDLEISSGAGSDL